jgi:hypothetical protein
LAKTYGNNTQKQKDAGTYFPFNEGDFSVVGIPLKITTEFVALAGTADGDQIVIGLIPSSKSIFGLQIFFEALGGAKLDIGDYETVDRYKTQVDVNQAGEDLGLNVAAVGYTIGTNYNQQDDTINDSEVIATVSGASSLTGTLKAVFYHT